MAKKISKKTVKNLEKFKGSIRDSQENLRVLIQDIEKKFFYRIKNWKTKDAKKLYKEYSMYVMIDDLLQAIDKATQRM